MSLRRVTGGEVVRTGFGIFARHEVRAGHVVVRLDRRTFERHRAALDRGEPVDITSEAGRTLWWASDGLYWEDEGLDAEAVGLLLWDRQRRHDARLDRLRKIRAAEEAVEGGRRARIPDEVRAFVWHRDDGRCVRCGSEGDLQFDHVIPVVKGGGVAAENIQVLCGDCNRRKSDSIV
ncbi:MAG: HNH endonuclease signature motif containing protein [Chloroflexi bacterium]|nr:HNH endonuclease signature motif containing protein [Chloroflexota bacterium]MDA1239381.1 HNH endonuclease signature motif containing protein [Chloroflexota bacterium]MQC25675.1 HNH endonuclease [Chloroflexota bacterium]MQC47535.1 HNH endonuclease [Chloroflexota bacterium]